LTARQGRRAVSSRSRPAAAERTASPGGAPSRSRPPPPPCRTLAAPARVRGTVSARPPARVPSACCQQRPARGRQGPLCTRLGHLADLPLVLARNDLHCVALAHVHGRHEHVALLVHLQVLPLLAWALRPAQATTSAPGPVPQQRDTAARQHVAQDSRGWDGARTKMAADTPHLHVGATCGAPPSLSFCVFHATTVMPGLLEAHPALWLERDARPCQAAAGRPQDLAAQERHGATAYLARAALPWRLSSLRSPGCRQRLLPERLAEGGQGLHQGKYTCFLRQSSEKALVSR